MTPPPATTRGALTLPPGSPPAAVVLRAKHIRATLAALDAASTRFWVDSLLARHLPILFNEAVWSTRYEIVPTPENKECCIISPGEPPRPPPLLRRRRRRHHRYHRDFLAFPVAWWAVAGFSSVYLSTRSLGGAARIEYRPWEVESVPFVVTCGVISAVVVVVAAVADSAVSWHFRWPGGPWRPLFGLSEYAQPR